MVCAPLMGDAHGWATASLLNSLLAGLPGFACSPPSSVPSVAREDGGRSLLRRNGALHDMVEVGLWDPEESQTKNGL